MAPQVCRARADRSAVRFPGWSWFLLAGALLAVAEGALVSTVPGDVLLVAIRVIGIGAVLVGIRRHRPPRPALWVLLATGATFWLFGDLLWKLEDRPGMTGVAFAPADLGYLVGYVVLAVALLRHGRRVDADGGLDALILAVATGAVLWTALVRPNVPHDDVGAGVAGHAYPALAAVIVAALVHLALTRVQRTPALTMLGLGFVAVLAGDVVRQVAHVYPQSGTGVAAEAVEPLWSVGYVLWGAAALHPSMRRLERTDAGPTSLLDPTRLVLLVVAGLTLPVIVLVELALGVERQPAVVSLFGALLITLVGARTWMLVKRLRNQTTQLTHAMEHDFLTGLLTRRALRDLLADAAQKVREGGDARPALMLVGLERFQEFSTTLGHRIGDELLRAVGGRLLGVVDAPGTEHARMGGDVFAVLVPDARDADDLLEQARAVAAAVREPFSVSDLEIDVDAGVGVVRVPDHGTDPAQLFHRADVALMAARTMRSRVAVWHPLMEAGGALAPELMAELAEAIEDRQLVVHFQPQLDVRSGRVTAVEALVRWNHPVHGLLGPVSFIPAAERTGQIRAVTRTVLDQALALAAACRADGRELVVSVNLSVRNLLDPRLVEDIREALVQHDVDPTLLELEITETSAMVEPDRSAAALLGLVDLGATISIDDYGTGYGSLAYLQNLPIGRLKIDRSFVGRVRHDAPSAAIVRSVIELSSRLGLSCVAEGVEDDETLLALQGMGCEMAQGFGLARPVPADRLTTVVDELERRMADVLGDRAAVGGR